MMTSTRSRVREGFSLMEILIAVMILGLVGAMVGPSVFNALKGARKSTTKVTLRSFKDAINMYQTNIGQLPQTLKDIIKKPKDPVAAKKWEGPYIEKTEVPEDPWGAPFAYKLTPGGKHSYELYSYGPSGKGSPKEEWISVWEDETAKK